MSRHERAKLMYEREHQLRRDYINYWNKHGWRYPLYSTVPLDKPEFYGVRVELSPRNWASLHFPYLKEAVEACTMFAEFSNGEERLCCMRRNNLETNACAVYSKKAMYSKYFIHNFYKKGNLSLVSIDERKYNSLSDGAKAYFEEHITPVFYDLSRKEYSPSKHISMTWLKESKKALYFYNACIPDSKAISTAKYLDSHNTGLYGDWCDIYYSRCKGKSYDRYVDCKDKKKERTRAMEAIRKELDEYEP